MAKLVSKTYGDALFETCVEMGSLDQMYEEVKAVLEVLKTDDDLNKFMNHPKVVKEDKIKVVEDSFTGRVSRELVGLMTIVISKGRFAEMTSIFEYFIGLVKEEKKIGMVHVATAIPLGEAQKAAVEKKILDTTEYESLEMDYTVDESLIGGMTVRIGDRVVDSSIKTKLYELSKELYKIQLA
jgi:F-type H+-transporting ATPase subunit delta